MNKPVFGASCPVFLQIFTPIYGAAWRLARPFLAKHKRLQQGLSSRLVPQDWVLPYPNGLTIWVQAASGGEAYLLVKLCKQIKEEYRGKLPLRILATTCTKQGMEVFERALSKDACIKNNTSDSVGSVNISLAYFPFDQPSLMEKALELAGPVLICLLETELWPGLLLAARKKSIPVLLLNGRITPKSLSGYKFLPASLWRSLAPTRILAISQPDANRFAELFANKQVELMPNIKFDLLMQEEPQVFGELKEEAGPCAKAVELYPSGGVAVPDSLNIKPNTLPSEVGLEIQAPRPSVPSVVVFGSVRRQEAENVTKAIIKLHNLSPNCLVILAPRHLHHVHLWEQQLKVAGSSYLLRSQIKNGEGLEPQEVIQEIIGLAHNNLQGQVVIWDRFGELKKLYAQADAVFVGGSLAPLGGQNFLEVLEHGLEPCIGPHWSNFAWAGNEVLALVKQVNSPEELALTLHKQLLNPKNREAVKANFKKFVVAHQGGAKAAAKAIIDCLPTTG